MNSDTTIGLCQELWHELSRSLAQVGLLSFDVNTRLVSYSGILNQSSSGLGKPARSSKNFGGSFKPGLRST
jgi:hypothetical protein